MSKATPDDDLDAADGNPGDSVSPIEAPTLRLDQFLKLCGLTSTGGQAKLLIQGGEVQVNGELETRRRRKLKPGDIVRFDGQSFAVDEYCREA